MDYIEPSNIEIYERNNGIVCRDNSLIAVDSNGRTVAIGREAQCIQQDDVRVYSPLKNGQIADWDNSLKVIKWYIMQAWKGHFLKKPKIMVCMLAGSTEVEKKAMADAMFAAGGKKVSITEKSLSEYLQDSDSVKYDLIVNIGQNFRV